jgi:nitroreductase
MNHVIETIKSRRSVRSFKPELPPKAELEAVLDAAIRAPSGMNAQVWRFTAVARRSLIDRLNARIRESLRSSIVERLRAMADNPEADFFYGAPVVVIASGEADSPTVAPDCAAALQNMMLAASSLGLGSCWVHAPTRLVEGPETSVLREELGIPRSHAVFGSIALGYASGPQPAAPERKEGCIAIIGY